MRTMRALAFILVPAISLAGILFCPNLSLAASAAASQDALHEVLPGDDLRLIAGYYYGDARQWKHIWKTNRAQIKNPNRIEQGSLLRIPDATSPTETYDEFLARVRGPRAPLVTAPAAEAAPSEGAPTLAAPATGIPEGEPLPPPSQPVTLRFKPAKGFAHTLRLVHTASQVIEVQGQTRPQTTNLRVRIHQAVESVGSDGTVQLAVRLSDVDAGGAPFSSAMMGLPEPGETLRLSANPLGKIVNVEGKQPGSLYYYSRVAGTPYPQQPLAVGESWQYKETMRTPEGIDVESIATCTLARRERFRDEEAFRIQCRETGTGASETIRISNGGTNTFVVRAQDGTLMFMQGVIQTSAEVPDKNVKVSMENRGTYEEEAPARVVRSAAPAATRTQAEAPAQPPTKAQAVPPPPAPAAPAKAAPEKAAPAVPAKPTPPPPAKAPAPAPGAPAPTKQAVASPAPVTAPGPTKAAGPSAKPTAPPMPPPKAWYEELMSPDFFTSIPFLGIAGALVIGLAALVFIRRRRSAAGGAE